MRMSVVGTVGLRPAQTLAQYLDRGSNDTHVRLISVQSIDPRTWIDRQTTRVSVVSGHVCCCVCLFQVVCVCILVVHVMFMSLCVSHMCYYLMSFFWMDTFVCVFWCIYMFLSVYLFISFSWGFLDLSVVQSDRLYMATYWDTNSVFNGQRVTCTIHWRALRCFRQNIATGVEVIWALWPMLCASKDKRMVSNSRNCVDVYLIWNSEQNTVGKSLPPNVHATHSMAANSSECLETLCFWCLSKRASSSYETQWKLRVVYNPQNSKLTTPTVIQCVELRPHVSFMSDTEYHDSLNTETWRVVSVAILTASVWLSLKCRFDCNCWFLFVCSLRWRVLLMWRRL